MGVRKLRPCTAGMRHRSASDFKEITIGAEKALLAPLTKQGGRNAQGRMTVRHRGGGHKRRYRMVDFHRRLLDVPARVKGIAYDPNRSARLALLHYANGRKAYILAPDTLAVGAEVSAGAKSSPELGNALPLAKIPLGTIVHNVELSPGRGGALARSAGTYVQLLAREGKYATLRLPSGERRNVLAACMATIGAVSNPEHFNVRAGKAGRSRWLGRRPRVRGVAMNPVDHPMGGGEGKASGGQPRSRTGLYAKGKRTRNTKKYSNRLILERRKS